MPFGLGRTHPLSNILSSVILNTYVRFLLTLLVARYELHQNGYTLIYESLYMAYQPYIKLYKK